MNVALKWGLVVRNVCSAIESPKARHKDIQPLTQEQSLRLLEESASNRLHAVFVLSVTTGLRQGELFARYWQDIDLTAGTISVRHTLEETRGTLRLKEPKSASGKRKVELPGIAVAALQDHRRRMMAEGNAGSDWVFRDSQGNPLRKSNFDRRDWKPLRAAAELPPIRFHDLRHTSATLLLSAGVHPKVVEERLGHANISLTLDTYSHVLPSMQKEAADKLDDLLAKRA